MGARNDRSSPAETTRAASSPWASRAAVAWTLAEIAAVFLAIVWIIWYGKNVRTQAWAGGVVFAWVLASFAIHGDTPKTLGMRADNLVPTTRETAALFGVFYVGLIAAGLALGAPGSPLGAFSAGRFLVYVSFCLLQQVALSSYLTNRLLSVFSRPAAIAAAALIFAVMHLPNPGLMAATLVAGVAMAWLFSRNRNILPLAMAQAVGGTILSWAFRPEWIHSMRVGPGYFRH